MIKKIISGVLCSTLIVSTMQINILGYAGQPLGMNVARNRNVTVSNNAGTTEYNKPDYLTDGDRSRPYQAAMDNPQTTVDPQTWQIDLGKSYTIDTVVLYWEAAAAKKYKIYTSLTGKNNTWELVYTEETGNKGKKVHQFSATDARYVKIELEERLMPYGYCMYELEVYTVGRVDEKTTENLARAATASASTDDGDNMASNAIDGDDATMWRTTYYQGAEGNADENITLSWASEQTFDTVKVNWCGGYMKGYILEISMDGVTWEPAAEVTNGKANEIRKIKLDKPATAKYLRLSGVTFGEYCFEIKEIEVYNETNIPIEKIHLNYDSYKLNLNDDSNKSITLGYNIGPTNTSRTEVVWASSNPAVATVQDGKITAVSLGKSEITLTSKENPSVSAKCIIYVSKELEKATVTATRQGKDINIKWNQVAHASSYILTRIDKTSGNIKNVYEGSATSFEDKNLLSGIYEYTVTAIVNPNDASADLYSNSTSNESESVLIPEDVEGIEISNEYKHIGLFIGTTDTVRYAVMPYNATNKNVTFNTSDRNVVTVDSQGVVTGVGEGDAVITVTTQEGNFKAECTVHVDKVAVKNIDRISEKNVTLNVNSSMNLEVNVLPENATYKSITWKSSNESIVSVDQTGKMTAKSSGYAIVTATADGKTTDFYIEVKSKITAIRLNYTSATVYLGKTLKINATIVPANATENQITWISSNDSIASVTANGLVQAKTEGVVFISAVSPDGKIIATCQVTSKREPVTKPAKVKIKSAKKSGTKVTLKWKKIKDAAGYQVYMKTGSGKYKKIKTITKAKTIKYSKKLAKGKTYKFKIRAYKNDGESKVYGSYSKVKTVKIK